MFKKDTFREYYKQRKESVGLERRRMENLRATILLNYRKIISPKKNTVPSEVISYALGWKCRSYLTIISIILLENQA